MFIKGIGHTKFERSKKSSVELGFEAGMMALKDANLKIEDIDAIVVAVIAVSSNDEHQRHFQALYSQIFGVNIPILCVVAACGSGGAAVFTANKLGYDNILVIGSEKLKSCSTMHMTDEFGMAGDKIGEQDEGLNFVAQNALLANYYMKKYKVSQDDLSAVSLKNYEFASKNPYAAFYGKKIDYKTINSSPVISGYLKLHHCSISVDGAAALVLSKKKTDIEIVASELATDYMAFFERDDFYGMRGTQICANSAYKKLNIKPSDIDVCEVHDAFASLELMAYEDLGFCKKGMGKKFLKNGADFKGRTPVNTSGGLKGKGHPISATGVSQIFWLTKQLRGDAGYYQVNNCKYALAQNMGGVGATVTVHILKKSGDHGNKKKKKNKTKNNKNNLKKNKTKVKAKTKIQKNQTKNK